MVSSVLVMISHSTVSSGVNSLSAVVIHDFIHPIFEKIKQVRMSDNASGILSKVLGRYRNRIVIKGLFFILYMYYTRTLSGRRGGYPDDNFRKEKEKKKRYGQLCNGTPITSVHISVYSPPPPLTYIQVYTSVYIW